VYNTESVTQGSLLSKILLDNGHKTQDNEINVGCLGFQFLRNRQYILIVEQNSKRGYF